MSEREKQLLGFVIALFMMFAGMFLVAIVTANKNADLEVQLATLEAQSDSMRVELETLVERDFIVRVKGRLIEVHEATQ